MAEGQNLAGCGLTLADLNWVNKDLAVGEGLLDAGNDMPPAPPVGLPRKHPHNVALGMLYGDDGVFSPSVAGSPGGAQFDGLGSSQAGACDSPFAIAGATDDGAAAGAQARRIAAAVVAASSNAKSALLAARMDAENTDTDGEYCAVDDVDDVDVSPLCSQTPPSSTSTSRVRRSGEALASADDASDDWAGALANGAGVPAVAADARNDEPVYEQEQEHEPVPPIEKAPQQQSPRRLIRCKEAPPCASTQVGESSSAAAGNGRAAVRAIRRAQGVGGGKDTCDEDLPPGVNPAEIAKQQARERALRRKQQQLLVDKQQQHLLALSKRREEEQARAREKEAKSKAFRSKVKKAILRRAQASGAMAMPGDGDDNGSGDTSAAQPHYLRDTGATKRGKVIVPKSEELTDEQKAAAEREKVERVSQIRRAFKSQTKKVLCDLQAKNKGKIEAAAQKEQLERERFERIKRVTERNRAKAAAAAAAAAAQRDAAAGTESGGKSSGSKSPTERITKRRASAAVAAAKLSCSVDKVLATCDADSGAPEAEAGAGHEAEPDAETRNDGEANGATGAEAQVGSGAATDAAIVATTEAKDVAGTDGAQPSHDNASVEVPPSRIPKPNSQGLVKQQERARRLSSGDSVHSTEHAQLKGTEQEQTADQESVVDVEDDSEELDEAAKQALEERKRLRRQFVAKQRAHLNKLVEERKARGQAAAEQATRVEEQRARVRNAAKQMQGRVANARQRAVDAARSGCIRDATGSSASSCAAAASVKGSGETADKDDCEEQKVVTQDKLNNIVERLHGSVPKRAENGSLMPAARDFDAFRKRVGIGKDVTVFAITGWYPVVKDELLARGWFHNTDKESPFWDFKWSLHSQDANLVTDEKQFINHFGRNVAITTKNGLVRNLRQMKWHQNVDADSFFPRCYILNDDDDMAMFKEDFMATRAEQLLKTVISRLRHGATSATEEPEEAGESAVVEGFVDAAQHNLGPMGSEAGKGQVEAEAAECGDGVGGAGADSSGSSSGDDSDDHTHDGEHEEDDEAKPTHPVAEACAAPVLPIDRRCPWEDIADGALEMLGSDRPFTPAVCTVPESMAAPGGSQPSLSLRVNRVVLQTALNVCRKRCALLQDEWLDTPAKVEPVVTDLEWAILNQCDLFARSELSGYIEPAAPEVPKSADEQRAFRKLRAKHQRNVQAARAKWMQAQNSLRSDDCVVPLGAGGLRAVQQVLTTLRQCFAQFDLNGRSPQNVWIVKPAGKSRGRGICSFDNLNRLLDHVGIEKHKEAQWVAQKYIENPLLIARRKFDIRQWVLISDWNPLVIWFCDECYLRFCVEEFDLSNLEDKFVHLANNSIAKNSENFNQTYKTESGDYEVEGNMWHSDDFVNHLRATVGSDDVWRKWIQPQMKRQVRSSMMCVQDMVENRKNSCELFGYDFMIDENYNPWLIEVNSSPACDYSTKVAERIVRSGLRDALKVVIEHRAWASSSSRRKGPPPDTGCWSKIHEGPVLTNPVASFGSDFEVKGSKLSRRQQKRI